MKWLLVALAVGCSSGVDHARVDPSLDLAISVWSPDTVHRVELDLPTDAAVYMFMQPVFTSPGQWAADVIRHNVSHEVSAPTVDGDLWSVELTERPDARYHSRSGPTSTIWYRPLGHGLAVECSVVKAFKAVTADDLALGRATCVGTQVANGDLYIPFKRPARGEVRVSWNKEKLTRTIELGFAPPDFDPEAQVIDRRKMRQAATGALGDGKWWLYRTDGLPFVDEDIERTRYDLVARRTLGGIDTMCKGESQYGRAYADDLIELCRALRTP